MTDRSGAETPSRLAAIAAATDLREGAEGVALILRTAFRDGPLLLRDLAKAVRMPLPVVGAVRRELERTGLLDRGQGVELSVTGKAFCRDTLGISARHDPRCACCHGHGVVVAPELAPALRLIEEHAALGPPVDVTLDQAPCTPETALRRALAMHEAGALDGRSIIILGDDDSMSVALTLLARAIGAAPRRVTVLELDPGRIAHLDAARQRHGLDFEVIAHDLRDPLPADLRGRFDVFETDPPYTVDGMSLFVSRGLEALRSEPGLPGFLSYGDLAPDDLLDLQSRLTDMGLVATRIRPSFNAYQGASILGSVGQLIDLRTTRRTKALTEAEAIFAAPIYTGEVRPRERRYQCRACGAVTGIGTGEAFATIEALKTAGCPACGETVFKRLHAKTTY
ncbi:bis-aminopropyl spermidine synthase family protein [Aureimonas sp. SA4125]|uniref:bis-aminopropyl spermidine synthase family protein n=1 Tax=Aureimonas sp. SA4125 TaxID=2826993 RepID=UPI001CC4ADA9|nr:bis-aminopropyl spermidine synthase family protein [Aureimonas sp. SA4125]